jgi:hypothetical protein
VTVFPGIRLRFVGAEEVSVRNIAIISALALTACGGVGPTHTVSDQRPASPSLSGSGPEVFVLGAIHGFHLKASYGYSYADLGAQIRAMRPDLVCAEITATDHNGDREAMFPWEVAVVEEATRAVGATFWPADWRPDLALTEVGVLEAEMTPAEKKAFEEVYADFMPRFERAANKVFEFWHSQQTQAFAEAIHDRMIDAGTEAAAGFWETRNQIIVKRCMRKATASKARRVLFVFGAEHKYAIEKYLRRFYRIDARPVVRLVAQSRDPVSADILARWKRSRDNLARLAESNALPGMLASQFGERYLKRLDATISAEGRPR